MHALSHDPSARIRDEADPLVVADLVVDPAAGRAWRGSRRLRLTPREFGILVLLASEPGAVHSRDEIYRAVWGTDAEPHSNIVDATISHLRGKVDWGHRMRLIHTARGTGYVLESHGATPGPRVVRDG